MVLLFQPLKIGFLWWQGTSVETWVSTLLGRFLSMLCLMLLDKIKIPNQKFNDFWNLEIYKKVYLFCNKFNFIWLLVAAPLLHCACFLAVSFYILWMYANLFILSNWLMVVRPWPFSYIVSCLVISLVLYLGP